MNIEIEVLMSGEEEWELIPKISKGIKRDWTDKPHFLEALNRQAGYTLCDNVFFTCKLPLFTALALHCTEAEKIPIHATEMEHLNWAVYTALY